MYNTFDTEDNITSTTPLLNNNEVMELTNNNNMNDDILKTEDINYVSSHNNNDNNMIHDNNVHLKMSRGHNVYIEIPWSPQIYFTVRGAENFHIYLWIAKDLSWSIDALYPAMIFGVAAMSWCGVLVYHAVEQRCYNEMYMLIPMILWLVGNFVWMFGEVINNDDDTDAPKAAIIMESAIAMILFYYFILKPFKILPPDDLLNKKYEEAELKPRFPFLFSNWREYEHAHTLCWLGKDLSWNRLNPYGWCICLVPTVLIALDFIYTTLKSKRMMIDCSHYMAQFIWVIGNMVWAMGEIFEINGNDDDARPYPLSDRSPVALRHCRWWSSVVLIIAYVPIFCLYCFWLPLTCMGKIKAADIPENDHIRTVSLTAQSATTTPSGAAGGGSVTENTLESNATNNASDTTSKDIIITVTSPCHDDEES